MSEPMFPTGWDAERVRRLIDHYESMSEPEQAEEDEAAVAEKNGETVFAVAGEQHKGGNMTPTSNTMKGLYVSYNEERHGSFEEAVKLSQELGCVTWFDKSPLIPDRLDYPTEIIVKISGKERYFRGILLAMVRAEPLPPDFEQREHNHRAPRWRECGYTQREAKTVLFISHLREEASKPKEVEGHEPKESPQYVFLSAERAQAWARLV